ncbi:dTMP kinase [Rhodococcus sp. D2-41]|uniref:Thymidylate kinase n=1 Tax=Speluncibacter jeojiensis TaxID=2710754 RepID=A0A9X4RCE8_9ACTN|nr:dTMP kinase [Rhodococcus sp. D2-41]MDG3008794.1 dTMP kinase [Rhodococcus sp. D2-41]MDG3012997.1 dTMP kinase [Corynebacteriales bacterium D3-21]
MGTLLVIEGVDGAGKRTLTDKLVGAWRGRGLSVATEAFPRYGRSVTADLGAEALRGAHGDLAESVYAMALMWALDRHAARGELDELVRTHDVVLLDRYVASNAAYGAARLHQEPGDGFVEWVRELEFERFALPVPDRQLYLDVPVELARARAVARAQSDPTRERDAYERDAELQARTAQAYRQLSAAGWGSPWTTVDPDADAESLADGLLG